MKTYQITGDPKTTKERALEYIDDKLKDKAEREANRGITVKVLDMRVEETVLFKEGTVRYTGYAAYTFLKDDKPLILGNHTIEGVERGTIDEALETLERAIKEYEAESSHTDTEYTARTITENKERGTFKAGIHCISYFKNRHSDLDEFMRETSRKVESWPSWKRNTGIMDKERQYNRYEPVSSREGNKDKK